VSTSFTRDRDLRRGLARVARAQDRAKRGPRAREAAYATKILAEVRAAVAAALAAVDRAEAILNQRPDRPRAATNATTDAYNGAQGTLATAETASSTSVRSLRELPAHFAEEHRLAAEFDAELAALRAVKSALARTTHGQDPAEIRAAYAAVRTAAGARERNAAVAETSQRPLTSRMSPSARQWSITHAPEGLEDYIVRAWDAIKRKSDTDASYWTTRAQEAIGTMGASATRDDGETELAAVRAKLPENASAALDSPPPPADTPPAGDPTMPSINLQNPNVPAGTPTARRAPDPLAAVDQRVRDYLRGAAGVGPYTAGQVRAAHAQVFGSEQGAAACVVRFDRAQLLQTASGELGRRGRLAQERLSRAPESRSGGLPPAQPAPAPARPSSTPPGPGGRRAAASSRRVGALVEEVARLRARYPSATPDQLAALAEQNMSAGGVVAGAPEVSARPASAAAVVEVREAAERGERAPRAPADPLRKSDPRVREAVLGEGHPIDRARLREVHAAVFGPRPGAEGPEREAWDRRFELCVPRLQRASLLLTHPRSASEPERRADAEVATQGGHFLPWGAWLAEAGLPTLTDPGGRARAAYDQDPSAAGARAFAASRRGRAAATPPAASGSKGKQQVGSEDRVTQAADARVMKESRPELSCLRKHALSVARVDADACPIGRSRAEGDALRASKTAALKQLEALWNAAVKATSPREAIGLLDQAADLVREKFPGIRLGYEVKAAGVLATATGGNLAEAAE
jgi:hypothetical protein